MTKNTFHLSHLRSALQGAGRPYLEFLRVPTLSMGLYHLAAGAHDGQQPHGEDEVYYAVSGRGRLRMGTEDQAVEPGTVAFVGARVDHRFHDITEDLTLLVFFAPAEGSSPAEAR
jgi:mannose-6-phosphate isomerase-like protein (cupin superfamily)